MVDRIYADMAKQTSQLKLIIWENPDISSEERGVINTYIADIERGFSDMYHLIKR